MYSNIKLAFTHILFSTKELVIILHHPSNSNFQLKTFLTNLNLNLTSLSLKLGFNFSSGHIFNNVMQPQFAGGAGRGAQVQPRRLDDNDPAVVEREVQQQVGHQLAPALAASVPAPPRLVQAAPNHATTLPLLAPFHQVKT